MRPAHLIYIYNYIYSICVYCTFKLYIPYIFKPVCLYNYTLVAQNITKVDGAILNTYECANM